MVAVNRSPDRVRRPLIRAGAAALTTVAMLCVISPAGVGAQTVECTARTPGGPVFVTEACTDPGLTTPYTDVDEERSTKDPLTGAKVTYRYVHGGFRNTKSTFSLYFPPKADYQGRFFQETYPTVADDQANPRTIAYAMTNGAYLVATNNNGGLPLGGELAGYRTNAAAAKHSREVAQKVYGTSERPRGYIFGASGGAYQTLASLENTDGVYDGGIPMVTGVPNAIPSFMTAQLLGSRVLGKALPKIVDALEPGGNGDPYAGLSPAERAALEEVTRLGFPLRGWWQYDTLQGGGFIAVEGGIQILDATYVDDFWTTPGYEGSDPAVAAARVRHEGTVEKVSGKEPVVVELPDVPTGDYVGADLVVASGPAAGKKVAVVSVEGNRIAIAADADPDVVAAIRPGTTVRLDNSWNIAMQYYQRHQVPSPDQYGWNQYRAADGAPASPQRSRLIGEFFVQTIGGSVPTGDFNGKMIMLGSLKDVQAFPWASDWYRRRVVERRGTAGADASYRLWFMDNADHDPSSGSTGTASTHIVPYIGELEQALLDLDRWVVDGTAPAAGTSYAITADNQVTVPQDAAERKGLQPTVDLTVGKDAASQIEVAAGEPVRFSLNAEAPPGGGKVIGVEWDFTGSGKYPERSKLKSPTARVTAGTSHTFTKPGTYFVTARVTAHRDGDPKDPFGRVQNLDRVRVVVE